MRCVGRTLDTMPGTRSRVAGQTYGSRRACDEVDPDYSPPARLPSNWVPGGKRKRPPKQPADDVSAQDEDVPAQADGAEAAAGVRAADGDTPVAASTPLTGESETAAAAGALAATLLARRRRQTPAPSRVRHMVLVKLKPGTPSDAVDAMPLADRRVSLAHCNATDAMPGRCDQLVLDRAVLSWASLIVLGFVVALVINGRRK